VTKSGIPLLLEMQPISRSVAVVSTGRCVVDTRHQCHRPNSEYAQLSWLSSGFALYFVRTLPVESFAHDSGRASVRYPKGSPNINS
jgi:hypothetical protein